MDNITITRLEAAMILNLIGRCTPKGKSIPKKYQPLAKTIMAKYPEMGRFEYKVYRAFQELKAQNGTDSHHIADVGKMIATGV